MIAIRNPGVLLGLLACCLFSALVAGPPTTAAPARQVYFVTGVDVPATVTMDGQEIGRIAAASVHGPVPSVPGRHRVEFTAAGWTAVATVELTGASTDVVVHRPADPTGRPRVTVFDNDVSPIAPGKARLTVAHTAVVPPADVRVGGKVLFANIANGEFVTAEVPAATYAVDIVPTGKVTPLFGPVDLPVTAGALNRVFAIGQPRNGGMDAVVQVIPLASTGSRSPTSVHAGEAGLVAASPTDDRHGPSAMPLVGALTAGVCAALFGGRRLRTRSRNNDT